MSDSVGNVRGWNGGASTGRSSTWDWRRVLENSPGPWEDGTNRDVWGGKYLFGFDDNDFVVILAKIRNVWIQTNP